jgi:hypothetical protein
LYDQNARHLLTATLKKSTPQSLLTDVEAYATTGDLLLYATPDGAPSGKVQVKLREGDKTYNIRQLTVNTPYLLELASYGSVWYAAVGAQNENKVYVYKDPVAQLQKDKQVLVPAHILKVDKPTYVSFAKGGRFAMIQNATRVAVYDEETDKGYAWSFKLPVDAPQTHVEWMDGYRMTYVSGGKAAIMDFDGINAHILSAANAAYVPFFNPNYNYLYTLSPQNALTMTPLMTPDDL